MIRNPVIVASEVLSHQRYPLTSETVEVEDPNGKKVIIQHEVYHTQDGVSVILYNQEKRTVILTRQFRLPVWLSGSETGVVTETCAGLLDGQEPEEAARREAEEETRYRLRTMEKLTVAWSTPGCVTEQLHYFAAPYTNDMKVGTGGGLDEESEHIELLEIDFEEALQQALTGGISDAKTILLLFFIRMKGIL